MKKLSKYLLWAFGAAWILQIIAGILFHKGNSINLLCLEQRYEALAAFAIIMLHLQILQEERYLSQEFGSPYVEYKRRVFRYLGRCRQE